VPLLALLLTKCLKNGARTILRRGPIEGIVFTCQLLQRLATRCERFLKTRDYTLVFPNYREKPRTRPGSRRRSCRRPTGHRDISRRLAAESAGWVTIQSGTSSRVSSYMESTPKGA